MRLLPAMPVRNNMDATLNFEKLARGVGRGTSLPSSPGDGQEYDYVADAVNGIVWRLRYRAASTSTHRWEFVGGSDVFLVQTTVPLSITVVIGVTASLKQPTYTIPLAGDYDTLAQGTIVDTVAGTAQIATFTVVDNVTPTALISSIPYGGFTTTTQSTGYVSTTTPDRAPSLTAGQVIAPGVQVNKSDPIQIYNLAMRVRPVRVS